MKNKVQIIIIGRPGIDTVGQNDPDKMVFLWERLINF